MGEGIVRAEKLRNFQSFESSLIQPSATFFSKEKARNQDQASRAGSPSIVGPIIFIEIADLGFIQRLSIDFDFIDIALPVACCSP